MRFNNYRNRYNKRNQIISEEDIYEMPLGQVFDRENEILAQNDEIGLPTRAELVASPNTRWVEPFINELGEPDGGYWQSILSKEKPLIDLSKINDNDLVPNSTSKQLDFMKEPQKISNSNEFDYEQENVPVFEGKVEKNIDLNKQTRHQKYMTLSVGENLQKKASKFNLPWTVLQYYGHSAHLADGEKSTEFIRKNNDFYKISDIQEPELQKIYIDKAVQMNKLDPSDPDLYDKVKNINIVMPKKNSQLYNHIKNSEDFQKWVAENYENIIDKKQYQESMEFPKAFWGGAGTLFSTIHNTDLKNAKINEDGGLSVLQSDGYDFDYIDKDKNDSAKAKLLKMFNNTAFSQQEKNQLKKYLLSTPIDISPEELDEILRKYGKSR